MLLVEDDDNREFQAGLFRAMSDELLSTKLKKKWTDFNFIGKIMKSIFCMNLIL